MKEKHLAVMGLIILLFGSGYSLALKEQSARGKNIDEWIIALGERNWKEAVDALAEIGELAVEPLAKTLKDKSSDSRAPERANFALAKIGTKDAVDAIIDALEDKEFSRNVRGFAATVLGDLGSKKAVVPLMYALKSDIPFVTWRSAEALGKIGEDIAVEELVEALKHEDQYLRAEAARALGRMKAGKAVESLVATLDDGHWLVRLYTRNALVEIGEPSAEPLIKALKDTNLSTRWQAAWALGHIQSEKAVESLAQALGDTDWMVRDEATVALKRISSKLALEPYPFYPQTIETLPEIPSPYTTDDGKEIVVAFTKNEQYALVLVTVENGEPYIYTKTGKGNQLDVDAKDFPALARTGLHSENELIETKTITGKSVSELTEMGRPGRSSGEGFVASDEDIISVLRGDNRLVKKMGLTHPQLARALFHHWNLLLKHTEACNEQGRLWGEISGFLYKGNKIFFEAGRTKGWQESLFDDEIYGGCQIEIWRELAQEEKDFLNENYSHLKEDRMNELIAKLSRVHIGEMVPYYIMRYGFYEGHTGYRADPIAISFVFGFKSIQEIEASFPGKLYETLTEHHTRENLALSPLFLLQGKDVDTAYTLEQLQEDSSRCGVLWRTCTRPCTITYPRIIRGHIT